MRKNIFENEERIIRKFSGKFNEAVSHSNLDSKIKSLLYVFIEDFTDLYIENHIQTERELADKKK